MFNVDKTICNAFQESCYVVRTDGGASCIIDPGCCCDAELDAVRHDATREGAAPRLILLTHGHIDHTAGASALASEFGIPIYMNPQDGTLHKTFNKMIADVYGFKEPEEFEYLSLSEGMTIELEPGCTVKVICTPGHTPGGVCFLFEEQNIIFSGDTLFAGTIGRTDHPGGDYDILISAIREKLMPLDGDIEVWPGHGPSTTIGRERTTNPLIYPQFGITENNDPLTED